MSEATSDYRLVGEQAPDQSPDYFLTLARRQIIESSLEQCVCCQQALLTARMANDAGDAELTGRLLRVARQHIVEFNRQLTGFDPE